MQLLHTLRIVLQVVFITLSIQVFRRLGLVPGLYTVLALAVGTVFGFESAGRKYLAAAPVRGGGNPEVTDPRRCRDGCREVEA